MNGLLITFEGIEGSGKTTQINRLSVSLRKEGYEVISTREPGGTFLGEQIRKMLLSFKNINLSPPTELFLYLASRSQHVQEILLPALEAGKIILCDRYSDATVAYQGFGRRLSLNFVKSAIRFSSTNLSPDLTLLLDIDPRQGLSRVRARGLSNRLDRENLSFHNRVRDGYLKMSLTAKRRIKTLDASLSPDEVARAIQAIMRAFLKNKRVKTRQGKK